MSDLNIRPDYYKRGGKIECIDYIMDKNLNFCLGNVVKYITRAGVKGDALDDLKKARQYLDFEIAELEADRNGGNWTDLWKLCLSHR